MEYEESERSGYQEREDMDFPEGVHIRHENRGIFMYSVFDGEEQVSDEFAPAQDNLCILFAEAYSKAKRKYHESG